MHIRRACVLVAALLPTLSARAVGLASCETADSARHLREVVVLSRGVRQSILPPQVLEGSLLDGLSTHSVADALRWFSGVQLKDYGGVGGIKTVDIRSMGSQHVGVFYDGIELGNAQNGQIDLGQLSLDNVEAVSLYNGQKSALLQPASDFGSAGSIYIRTRVPRFADGKRHNLRFRAQYGSSDLLRLSALWEQRLSQAVSTSFNVGTLTASGRYTFRYRRRNLDGTTAYDTTATRHNGDVQALRAELNVNGAAPLAFWNVKGYVYASGRGIPGAIVNNVWRRGERQDDLNTFVQGRLQRNIGSRLTTQLLAKWAFYRTRYVNRDTTQMPVDNRYWQQELYVSTANAVQLTRHWSASVCYDFRWNKLNADLYAFARPRRQTHLVSLATAIATRHLHLQGSLLETFVHDVTRNSSDAARDRSKLTPAVTVCLYPLRQRWLALQAFAKKSFRMPTFNDLYYTNMGNAALRPESALQYDLGCRIDKDCHWGCPVHVGVQVDGYWNAVHDKIIAYPKGQQFRWTMLNLGKVHVKGVDVSATATAHPAAGWSLTARLQYSFQEARDVTDAATPYYKDQIPYIPRHSGSAVASAEWRSWTLRYSFIYTGERYNEQENIAYNHVEPWYTHDLSLQYAFRTGRTRWRATLEVNNLFDQDYEVIAHYPMPGRNGSVALQIEI